MTMGRLLIALAVAAQDPGGFIYVQPESVWMPFPGCLFLMLRLVSYSEEFDLLKNTLSYSKTDVSYIKYLHKLCLRLNVPRIKRAII